MQSSMDGSRFAVHITPWQRMRDSVTSIARSPRRFCCPIFATIFLRARLSDPSVRSDGIKTVNVAWLVRVSTHVKGTIFPTPVHARQQNDAAQEGPFTTPAGTAEKPHAANSYFLHKLL